LFDELYKSTDESDRIRFNDLHNKKGELKRYQIPREYIKRLHRENLGRPLYYNTSFNLCILGCLGENTKVRMFNGSVKNVQDIVVGDKLMGPDSKVRNVINTFNAVGPLYNISTRYGESFQATDTHILRLNQKIYTARKGKNVTLQNQKNISVGEYVNLRDNKLESRNLRTP